MNNKVKASSLTGRTNKKFLVLAALFFIFFSAQSLFALTIGNDDFYFINVQYDYPRTGESTWYYKVSSGDAPAISHVTFVVNLDCLEALEGGTWDGSDYTSLNPNGGQSVIGKDQATGYYGVKFDLGFDSYETRYYYFTVGGNYAAGDITAVSKAASSFDEALLTGPSYDCTAYTPQNPPLALDDSALTAEDTPVFINVSLNDSDVDGDLEVFTTTTVSDPANGTAVNNGDGTFTYTPDPDFFGSDSFTYEVYDVMGHKDEAVVTIVVTSVNDDPVASDDSESVNENSSVVVDVLSNDSAGPSNEDPNLAVVNVTSPSNGTAVVNPDGSITYTPSADFNGTDSFSYTIEDSDGLQDTAVVTIEVVGPVANDNSYVTEEDTAITVPAPGILVDDYDPDGDNLIVSANTEPSNGTLVQNSDGSFSYTPDQDFNGTDSYSYTVSDGNGGTDDAVVTIVVTPVNDPPVAVNDSVVTDEDTEIVIPVLSNDSDPDGDSLVVKGVTQPANGSVVVNPDGTVTYTPDENFSGTDSFSYTVDDGKGGSDTATVYVTVNPVNDPPKAVNDTAETDEDVSVVISVAGNDSDPEGDNLSVSSATDPANGSVEVNGDGTVTYTPDENFFGEDSFTYTISDGNGGSDTAVVKVVVTPVNDAPVAVDDSASVDEDDSVVISVLPNDSDPEGDNLSVISVTQPDHGTATVNPDGTVTYEPDPDYYGEDSFTYTISDGNGGTGTATAYVTVVPVNDPPVAAGDQADTDEDVPVVISVLPNDSDPEGDVLSVVSASDPAHGSVVVNPDGTITYTPDADYSGADSFTYTVSDGNGGTDTASVKVNVLSVNDPPVAVDDSVVTDEDTALNIPVLSNDSDVDNDPISVVSASDPVHGSVVINPDGTVTYTPDADYNGSDSFTYTIEDSNGLSDEAVVNVTVNPVNDAPVAVDDYYSTAEDTPLNIPAPGVVSNDSDVDGDSISIDSYTQPSSGTVTLNPDGSFSYVPAQDFYGEDSFTYVISDGNGGSDTAVVFITVIPVNDPPVADNDTAVTDEDVSVALDLASNDSDVDGNLVPGSIVIVSAPSNGTVVNNGDGTVTYVPDANFNGTDNFVYEIADSDGLTDQAVADITINSVNDAPVAADDSYSTYEDTALVIPSPGILINDSDVDGDYLVSSENTDPSHGILTVNEDGSFSYVPDADYNGSDSFTYTVSDGNGGTDTADVVITVIPVNDAPVAVDDSYSVYEDTELTVYVPGILGNDYDVDGDTLSVVSNTETSNGSVTVNAGGSITYVPDANFFGIDSFVYTISDGNGGTDTAVVTIDVVGVNDLPAAVDDSYVTQQDTALTVTDPGVLVNDSDVDGDALFVSSSDPVSQFGGSVAVNSDGSFAYTPVAGFAGYDTFEYTVSDGNGGYDTAVVTIEVEAANNRSISLKILYFLYDGSTLSGQIEINNQSDGYDVQITDLDIEVQYRLPKGAGWVTVDVVDGSTLFNPSPLFTITDSQVVNFSGTSLEEAIPSGLTVRLIAKAKIYGRFNGNQNHEDGWFLYRKTGKF